MAKKPVKKVASTPAKSNFSEFDRVFENFRSDLEKSFSSFPRIDFSSFPKLAQSGCDVIDEGSQFRMKMNMPGLKKNEIKLNVTDNSIEVTGEHKEEEKKEKLRKKGKTQYVILSDCPIVRKGNSWKSKSKTY
ncbi:MAG: Hsp20/alpha crystallin family protein [Nitrosopumilus sp.]